MVKITNMYQNNDDDSFPTEALREGRKAAKGIRKSKAVEDIISSGYPCKEINGSIYITMPDNRVMIYYPQARKWRVKGKGKYYKAFGAKQAIATYIKNMKKDIFSVDTETNKYSIEELQKYMNNSFE
jgi:hypothetical protein